MGLGFWEVVGTAYQGYFLACLVPGLLLPLSGVVVGAVSNPDFADLADLTPGYVSSAVFFSVMIVGLCFGGALVLALPGFVLMRGLLFWARIGSPLGFALAGALNAFLLPFLWSHGGASTKAEVTAASLAGTVAWAALGAFAGLVSWRVETRFLGAAPSSASPAKAEPQS